MRRRASGDRGVSLVELLVAVAVLGAVLVASFDALLAVAGANRDQERVVTARQDLRMAMRLLGKDVRGATAVLAPPSGPEAPGSLTLVLPGPAVVRWRLDGAAGLVRETLAGAGGPVSATRVVLAGATLPAGTPLFTYLDAGGRQLDPGAIDPARLAACVQRVRVSVALPAPAGERPPVASTDHSLRARDPAVPCDPVPSSALPGQAYAAAVAATAPLGSWRLGEPSGVLSAANSGSAGSVLDGIWEPAVARSDGVFAGDGAARFPGGPVPPYVDLGTAAPLAGTHPGWSVAAWVRPDADHPQEQGTLVRKGVGQDGFALTVHPEGWFAAQVGLSGGGRAVATAPPGTVRPRQWSFLVATYDGSHLRLYANGVPVASQAQAGTVDLGAVVTRTVIGATSTRERPFVGAVDELAVWTRALSAAEVTALYRAAG